MLGVSEVLVETSKVVRKGYGRNCRHHALEVLNNPVPPPSTPSFRRGWSSGPQKGPEGWSQWPQVTLTRFSLFPVTQVKSVQYRNIFHAYSEMTAAGGALAVYRGFLPNMLKNLPTNSVRLASFDGAKKLIQEADVAMMELRAQLNFKPSKSTALC